MPWGTCCLVLATVAVQVDTLPRPILQIASILQPLGVRTGLSIKSMGSSYWSQFSESMPWGYQFNPDRTVASVSIATLKKKIDLCRCFYHLGEEGRPCRRDPSIEFEWLCYGDAPIREPSSSSFCKLLVQYILFTGRSTSIRRAELF